MNGARAWAARGHERRGLRSTRAPSTTANQINREVPPPGSPRSMFPVPTTKHRVPGSPRPIFSVPTTKPQLLVSWFPLVPHTPSRKINLAPCSPCFLFSALMIGPRPLFLRSPGFLVSCRVVIWVRLIGSRSPRNCEVELRQRERPMCWGCWGFVEVLRWWLQHEWYTARLRSGWRCWRWCGEAEKGWGEPGEAGHRRAE
jgi:hypothetical protein